MKWKRKTGKRKTRTVRYVNFPKLSKSQILKCMKIIVFPSDSICFLYYSRYFGKGSETPEIMKCCVFGLSDNKTTIVLDHNWSKWYPRASNLLSNYIFHKNNPNITKRKNNACLFLFMLANNCSCFPQLLVLAYVVN